MKRDRDVIEEGAIVKLSMGMLITMGTGLVLLTGWLITLSVNVNAQGEDVKAAKSDQKAYFETLHSIDTRLSVIESEMKRIQK